MSSFTLCLDVGKDSQCHLQKCPFLERRTLNALCAGEEGGAVHPHPVPDARHHQLPVLHQPEEGAEHLGASVRLHAGQLYPQVITGTWKICIM